MNLNMAKRILSLVLTLALLLSNFPMVAFAAETDEVHEHHEEHVAETEVVAEPTATPETAVPTEAATEPVEETTAPTQPETVTEETSAPSEEVTDPTGETEPAPEVQSKPESETVKLPIRVNPLYKGIFSAKDFPMNESAADEDGESNQFLAGPAYLSLEEAAKELRKHMVSRDKTFTLYFKAGSKNYESHLTSMLTTAVQHTGNPKEGDYLQWHFAGWGGKIEYYRDGSTYYYTFKAEMVYTTTAAQENELSKTITSVINQLGVRKKSDYQKVKAIYDYICENVTYDYKNSEVEDYLLKYSAYAALVEKSAVAEGFATLLYRIMLELDMDTRVIAGLDMDGAAHVWNITRIGDVYYNLDATWDVGSSEHVWFLRNTANFPYHYRYMDYSTSQFHTDYPMAQDDYVDGVPGVPEKYFIMGMCGDEVAFGIDRERNLVIAGNGPMWDFTSISDSNKDNCPPWYYWINDFDRVVIEEGVTTIGQNAFRNMPKITSVALPDTLVEIGDFAFGSLTKLDTIVLPSALKKIGNEAFSNCALTNVNFGAGLETIGERAFYQTQLTEVVLQDNMLTLGAGTFESCYYLQRVDLGGSLKTIGSRAFQCCYELSEVVFPETLEKIESRAFTYGRKLTEITIPDSVKSIGNEAFLENDLEKVSFGAGLETIGDCAFSQTQLQEVILQDNVLTLGERAFGNCSKLQKVDLGSSLQTIGLGAFQYCYNLSEVVFSETLKEIGRQAFINTALSDIVIPDSVTTLGVAAFSACGQLQSVKLGNSLTVIPSGIFQGCNLITTVTIPESVTNIGSSAFSGTVLTEIELPEGLVSIGAEAFMGTALTEVVIPDNVTVLASRVFAQCVNLQQIDLSSKLERIENGALSGCTNLTSISVPDSVTYIGQGAFSCCSNLVNVNIPAGVTSIAVQLFNGCPKLETVLIPASVTSIGQGAFAGCKSLTGIDIPSGVTAIEPDAFSGCASFKSVIVPAAVTSVGYNAFSSCTALEEIVFLGDAPTFGQGAWGNPVFTGTTATAYYPAGNETWTADVLKDYGGTITWVARCMNHACTSVEVVAPTCAENGYTFHFCPVCGDGYRTDEVPLLGHIYSDWIRDAEANCTEDGSRHRTCSRCDYVDTEVFPALGHTVVVEEGIPVTCTEDGLSEGSYCTACGIVFQIQEVIPARGHVIKSAAAVAPTCTEVGLTEGSYCINCGEAFIPQEEIPALGHDFASAEDGIACNNCGETITIYIPQDYALMSLQVLESVRLAAEVSPAHLAEEICWSIEGDEGVLAVEQDGTATAIGMGTAYVVATLTYGEFALSARCRVDVTEELQIAGIQLSTDKLTTELYSTDYAGLEIHLQLPQNNSLTNLGENTALQEDLGIAIENACFRDDGLAKRFDIRVLDDRRIEIIPTNFAVNNPKVVGSKYSSSIVVTILGKEFVSEPLTLTVKKTMPKLKGTVAAFNSFYSGQSQQIVITDATPTAVYEDASKNTAKATAIPNWLILSEDGTLTLNEKAPLKSASAKAYLLVDTAEWRIPAAVTVSIKNTYKARGLKLSASSVTFTTLAENSNGVKLNLLATSKNETLADLKVIGITAPAGYIVENFNIADGSFVLKTETGFKAGAINLGVTFEDTSVTQPLKLTVKTAKVTLKASATKVTLNVSRNDSAVIDITATPADYQINDPVITLTGTETVNKKKVTVDKLNSGELDVAFEDGKLRIATTSTTPDKASYKLSISAGGSKAVTITINTVSAVPSVTYKATGSMDLSFPNQAATITPTFKNCGNGFDKFEYTVAEMKGKTVVSENVSGAFEIVRDGNTIKIRCIKEDINISNTYALKLKLILEDGNSVENTISLKVKRTAVKLKLSTTKLTLNKLIGDKATIDVSCTTKGYNFTEPSIELKDSKNKDATGQLNIAYDNGKLNIATNDETVYGASYKVLVKANAYAAASTITVTVPKADKSAVTTTVKASGSIDVIRDGGAITLTPAYKNVTAQTEKVESLVFYKTVGNATTEVSDLFRYTVNSNGTITVKKAKDAALDHSAKYTVKLVTDVNGSQICESKPISISVKMGATKLTLKANDTMLFAQDKHDRVVFSFNAADKTLNEVVKVEIKDAKNKDIFEVYDYGNGEFAIGFKDETVSEKLIGKKASLDVTLNLNVFIDGNETVKPNTTAKIKLTIVK